ASAHAVEAAVNVRSPAASTMVARSRWTKKTSASAATATAALYAVTTHDTPSIVVWKRVYSSGRASTTIDESANAIATAVTTSPTSSVELFPRAEITSERYTGLRDASTRVSPSPAITTSAPATTPAVTGSL